MSTEAGLNSSEFVWSSRNEQGHKNEWSALFLTGRQRTQTNTPIRLGVCKVFFCVMGLRLWHINYWSFMKQKHSLCNPWVLSRPGSTALSPGRPMRDFPFIQTWQAQFEHICETKSFWLDKMLCKMRYFAAMLILNKKYVCHLIF